MNGWLRRFATIRPRRYVPPRPGSQRDDPEEAKARSGKGKTLSDIFDEVDEDLRADRARKLLQKYGGLLVGAAVLVVIGVGGFKAWQLP